VPGPVTAATGPRKSQSPANGADIQPEEVSDNLAVGVPEHKFTRLTRVQLRTRAAKAIIPALPRLIRTGASI